ncbi:hypothetical protein PWT90_03698 [Aphanocladium album]|nr:hypothetical protein PWT90_03698 [Aphanocladium album]
MSYSYSYISTTPRYYEPDRYSTQIRIDTPGLSYSSSSYTTVPRQSSPDIFGYTARDEQLYDYHHNYCYGAGPSYPADTTNWEPNRAAPHRLYCHRIRIRSGACLDELPSRHLHRDSNMCPYRGHDRAAARSDTTTRRTTTRRTTRRTTITITTT